MEVSSPEKQNGRMVLDIYRHFNVKAHEVLVSNNFVAWAGRNRVRIDDVSSGLNYALKQGWISEQPNGSLELTMAGFDLM